MNRSQFKSVLSVLNYLGIKARVCNNFITRQSHIGVVHNKAGDTLPFNPYTRLGDSMLIAMLMNMTISFKEDEIKVQASNSCISIARKKEARNREVMRVGNLIINCAIEVISNSRYDFKIDNDSTQSCGRSLMDGKSK